MSIPGAANPLLLRTAAAGGYQISRSLRFNSSDSAYLSRTPASAGNRKTWTWAGWVKRVRPTWDTDYLFGAYYGGSLRYEYIAFTSSDRLEWFSGLYDIAGTTTSGRKITSAVFRDTSAWYHIVAVKDTTQATAANRFKLYVNGVQISLFDTSTDPALNDESFINDSSTPHRVGGLIGSANSSQYLADVHFIDGQALDPTSFTEVSATTGQLIPKAYTGSFGTNGFWLKFSDNSAATATTLGKDYSGNSNNWTPNNLSVTAGAGNDSLVDTPTSYGTDTGAGGEVRGNYCTWNPVGVSNQGSVAWTLSDGNLVASDAASNIYGTVPGTMAVSSGKWYWEVTVSLGLSGIDPYQGIGVESASLTDARNPWTATKACYYLGDGYKAVDAVRTAYGTAWSLNDVIGVALDMDANTVTFYRNNTSQGSISISPNGAAYRPAVGDYNNGKGSIYTANFGQRPFAYTAPSGFKALCDTNLPAPVVAKPSTVMDVKLYTGNGSTQSLALSFSPDFLWFKARSDSGQHALYDIIRGASKSLVSNSTAAEATEGGGLSTFDSAGFSLSGDNTVQGSTNGSGRSYVAWAWDAGSSTITNTQGSITSQVRANASAGFSIVTASVSASASGPLIGHGLGVTPALVIGKNRSSGVIPWYVWSSSLAANNKLILNSTAAAVTDTNTWGSMTSSTLQMGATGTAVNVAWIVSGTQDVVFYCFAPVAGYSSFGSYTGNGSADGPFVYTGHRSRWVLIKNTGAGGNVWVIYDTARDSYNIAGTELYPNLSNAEAAGTAALDIVSNGFKIRSISGGLNASGNTYIFASFAESPFAYSRAR